MVKHRLYMANSIVQFYQELPHIYIENPTRTTQMNSDDLKIGDVITGKGHLALPVYTYTLVRKNKNKWVVSGFLHGRNLHFSSKTICENFQLALDGLERILEKL